MEALKTYRKEVDKRLAEFNLVRRQVKEEKEALESIQEKIEYVLEAQDLTQRVTQQIQQQIHNQIASVVSRCLEAVFDEPYEFKIHFEKKRGRTEARLTFVREGVEVDPLSASGGGVVDVAAFALRQSCLMLTRPPLRRFMALDEPFKFVSEGLRDRISILLMTLAKELETQFLIVTHMEELKVGKIIQL